MRSFTFLFALVVPSLVANAQQDLALAMLGGLDAESESAAGLLEGRYLFPLGSSQVGLVARTEFASTSQKKPPCPKGVCPPPPDLPASLDRIDLGPRFVILAGPTLVVPLRSRLSLEGHAAIGYGWTLGGSDPTEIQAISTGTESGVALGWSGTLDLAVSDQLGLVLGYRGSALNLGEVPTEGPSGTLFTAEPEWVYGHVVALGLRVGL